jgi:lipopolysaccharide transport system ATP-binding protein
MTSPAIRIEHLGKQYRIGGPQLRYKTIRESLVNLVKNLFNTSKNSDENHIWALKDVSFEIQPAEVVGVIGRNGAGKSTLLKVLAHITNPTEGKVEIRGRIGSLLEVGTGFHPELTGRENIYLNGAVLGMKRTEIIRKFDEIVDFAEIEKFLDTPVKHYSSGMYMRLAFAVAAHLEPEILLVDEVLAVGDAAFQKKCMGKMGEVAKEGRTVLFVSHNMVAVQSLCQNGMLLDKGELIQTGPVNQIVSNYLQYCLTSTQLDQTWENEEEAPGLDEVRLHRISLQTRDQENKMITMDTPILVIVEYWNKIPASCLHITLHIRNEQGIIAFTTGSCQEPEWKGQSLEKGLYRSICQIPKNLLNSGRHSISILVVKNLSDVIFTREDALIFDVVDNREISGGWFGKEHGVVSPLLNWSTKLVQPQDSLSREK